MFETPHTLYASLESVKQGYANRAKQNKTLLDLVHGVLAN